MIDEWGRALARYAGRFHPAIGTGHHVASPLGAWLLLALTGSIDTSGPDGDLAEALGMDPARAAESAAALLDDPHPLVAAAAAVWHTDRIAPDRLAGWQAALPRTTTFGPLPDQDALDRWAREHTFDLIDSFPIERSPELAVLLASALATRVSWDHPFDVAPAGALGSGSAWASTLSRVLRTPERGHTAFIADSEQAGEVVVHVAPATWQSPDRGVRAALNVVSVAAAPDVEPHRVLAAAYELAIAAALDERHPAQTSLFDLPLGEAPLWTITERRMHAYATEQCRAVLPCWSATNDHDLSAPELGFPAVTRAVAALLDSPGTGFEARQTAMARYGRYGFEAAAVTGYAVTVGLPPEATVRFAELRFGHPYAVVAVTTQRVAPLGGDHVTFGPWHGVPVFSAWVSDPEDVPDADLSPPSGHDPQSSTHSSRSPG